MPESGPKVGALRGPQMRLGQVTHVFEFLPPWTLRDMFGVTAHCCGRCFRKLGDDPFNGRPGAMQPGAPPQARCAFCERRCFPYG